MHQRYSYDNLKIIFPLNHRVKENKDKLSPVEHQFRILKMLGIDLRDKGLELWFSRDDEEYAQNILSAQWLSDDQKIVGINMAASKNG